MPGPHPAGGLLIVDKNMKQLGAVLVFKPGTTREEAEKALAKISALVDPSYFVGGKPQVHSFDRAHGGPVWYIP
jgi:hypothetical protein